VSFSRRDSIAQETVSTEANTAVKFLYVWEGQICVGYGSMIKYWKYGATIEEIDNRKEKESLMTQGKRKRQRTLLESDHHRAVLTIRRR
jgi:hypothetical protein